MDKKLTKSTKIWTLRNKQTYPTIQAVTGNTITYKHTLKLVSFLWVNNICTFLYALIRIRYRIDEHMDRQAFRLSIWTEFIWIDERLIKNKLKPFILAFHHLFNGPWIWTVKLILPVLPLQDQGFHLHKQEFWDALHLHYGWKQANTSSHCVCGSPFTPDHAMICQHGGLFFVHHNEIRDITAEWLNKVCYDVAIEPPLQQLNGEAIVLATANRQDEVCADIHARGFWGRCQSAFLMSGFFTQMHLVIATQISHPSIGVMSRRRSGSMEIVLGRLRRPLLLP